MQVITLPELSYELWTPIIKSAQQPAKTAVICSKWNKITLQCFSNLFKSFENDYPSLKIFVEKIKILNQNDKRSNGNKNSEECLYKGKSIEEIKLIKEYHVLKENRYLFEKLFKLILYQAESVGWEKTQKLSILSTYDLEKMVIFIHKMDLYVFFYRISLDHLFPKMPKVNIYRPLNDKKRDKILTWIKANLTCLDSIKFLNLDSARITNLPVEIKYLTKLKRLYASRCSIVHLPSEISYLKELKTLDLSHTSLTILPPEICHLTRLKDLNLNDTSIVSLPSDISYLTHLNYLYLKQTSISSFPIQISTLTRLRTLEIGKSLIKTLPPQISCLTCLEYLYLYQTLVREIPPEIGQLTRLKRINISNTLVRNLPSEINQLTQLEMLNFYKKFYQPSNYSKKNLKN